MLVKAGVVWDSEVGMKPCIYVSICRSGSPSPTSDPAETKILVILPLRCAKILFSIFIASIRATISPAATVAPSVAKISSITPGMGEQTWFGVPPLDPALCLLLGAGAVLVVLG